MRPTTFGSAAISAAWTTPAAVSTSAIDVEARRARGRRRRTRSWPASPCGRAVCASAAQVVLESRRADGLTRTIVRAGSRRLAASSRAGRRLGVRARPRPRGRGSPRRRGRRPSRTARVGRPGRTASGRSLVTVGTGTGRCAWPPPRRRRPGCGRCARASRPPARGATTTAACPSPRVDEYSVSPWNSGCGNATSVNPRLATMVPCVSCATELPDQHRPASSSSSPAAARTAALGGPRRVEVQRLRVHGQRA